ncbi:metal ABC transporter ATP-binding protein [Leuconostoc litchii]|uniref:ATP-binding cassette domain-containing protein n=1 Tax=Leuconostoc litchii TaxID=1981069 RepID=A0A6P2CSB8_9LACO|nr:ATP-binding cassette domain-containing protein [Leuconostoc litchii]TYC47139.1 ATP-binding cassette domain-containing protein [Leuconostoc litchii]
MSKKILQVEQLNVTIPGKVLIHQLSFDVYSGTLLCLTGDNGVGKTTLIKYLLQAAKDTISFQKEIRFNINFDDIQLVPQFRDIDDEFPLSVKDFIVLNLTRQWLPWLIKSENEQLQKIINLTNLNDIKNRALGRASGGEKQRVYLAQALMTHPKLLILDESTSNLDYESRIDLLKLVKKIIAQEQLTVIFITHDPELVQMFGDFELNINNGHGELSNLRLTTKGGKHA